MPVFTIRLSLNLKKLCNPFKVWPGSMPAGYASAKLGVLAVLTLILSQWSCNPREVQEELQFTRLRPPQSGLVGTWVPTANSVKDMEVNGGYVITRHQLTLKADGSFSMLNMPDWWNDGFGNSRRTLESTSGEWKLAQDASNDWVIDLRVGSKSINSVHLRNQAPPYKLHIGVGDPDNGHFMLFERQ